MMRRQQTNGRCLLAASEPDDPSTDIVRVLVVDDEPLFAQAVTATLAGAGRIEVIAVAGDGTEAVRLAASLRPDLVLMDLNMPLMGGIEATCRILKAVPSARVVVVTGSRSERDVDEARQAGAVAYLTKDCVDELAETILEIAA